MAPRTLTAALAALALLPACGSKDVEVSSYTCGDFTESFRDKDDTSAGNFIRQLSDRVEKRPGVEEDALQQQVGASVAIVCGGKPGDFKPASAAIALVNRFDPTKPPKPAKKRKRKATEDDSSSEP